MDKQHLPMHACCDTWTENIRDPEAHAASWGLSIAGHVCSPAVQESVVTNRFVLQYVYFDVLYTFTVRYQQINKPLYLQKATRMPTHGGWTHFM